MLPNYAVNTGAPRRAPKTVDSRMRLLRPNGVSASLALTVRHFADMVLSARMFQ
jgi:hypothetical protein